MIADDQEYFEIKLKVVAYKNYSLTVDEIKDQVKDLIDDETDVEVESIEVSKLPEEV